MLVHRKESMMHEVRMDFLEEWSSELAYFLGLVITDGEVGPGYVIIDLEENDREVLEHIRDWISPTRKIHCYVKDEKTTYCRLAITNKLFAERVMDKYQIYPNKTGSENIGFDVPEEMLPHFFRGVFDGDGFVSTRRRKNGGKILKQGLCLLPNYFWNN